LNFLTNSSGILLLSIFISFIFIYKKKDTETNHVVIFYWLLNIIEFRITFNVFNSFKEKSFCNVIGSLITIMCLPFQLMWCFSILLSFYNGFFYYIVDSHRLI